MLCYSSHPIDPPDYGLWFLAKFASVEVCLASFPRVYTFKNRVPIIGIRCNNTMWLSRLVYIGCINSNALGDSKQMKRARS